MAVNFVAIHLLCASLHAESIPLSKDEWIKYLNSAFSELNSVIGETLLIFP
jgi:hypothetical protein